MKTKKEKTFDTVKFFGKVKRILAERMEGMSLTEQKEFMKQIREEKIKISVN